MLSPIPCALLTFPLYYCKYMLHMLHTAARLFIDLCVMEPLYNELNGGPGPG